MHTTMQKRYGQPVPKGIDILTCQCRKCSAVGSGAAGASGRGRPKFGAGRKDWPLGHLAHGQGRGGPGPLCAKPAGWRDQVDRPIDLDQKNSKGRRPQIAGCGRFFWGLFGQPLGRFGFPLGCPWLVHRNRHIRKENSTNVNPGLKSRRGVGAAAHFH